jgi:inner membrane protein
MDSLTQITLGAAVGEVVLGRKVGNRAMLWGAIAGTIPDLDVFANLVTDEITALAFHRGITHSLFFAALAPFGFGWLVYKLYHSNLYRRQAYKIGNSMLWLLLLAALLLGIGFQAPDGPNFTWIGGSLIGILFLGWLLRRVYWQREQKEVEATYRDWIKLFFWAIITHPLLDSCTDYGTQLFQPFLDYRVAFNNISVVDPIYTLPFLFCLVIALSLSRRSPRRRFFNWLGIALSSAYLLFTFYNKYRVDQVYRQSLAVHEIPYERYRTSPSILNNILWQGVAEGDSVFYFAQYSLFDPTDTLNGFTRIPKNHHLIQELNQERDIQILQWFSDGYYGILEREDGQLQFNDLRFGSIDGTFDDESDYVFRFILQEEEGRWVARQSDERPDFKPEMFQQFWDRLMGRTNPE